MFFEAGPQLGFLMKAQDTYNSSTTTLDENQFNTLDLGYVVGLGYQRKTGLGIGLRYNGGITNVRKEIDGGPAIIQPRSRNEAFQLYLTYSLNGR